MLRKLLAVTALIGLIAGGNVFAQGAGLTVPPTKTEIVKSENLVPGLWGSPTIDLKADRVACLDLVAGVWGSPTTCGRS